MYFTQVSTHPLPSPLFTVDSIIDIYTVSQLKLKAQENPEPFFGITYSFISKLALDSSVSKVIRTRW